MTGQACRLDYWQARRRRLCYVLPSSCESQLPLANADMLSKKPPKQRVRPPRAATLRSHGRWGKGAVQNVGELIAAMIERGTDTSWSAVVRATGMPQSTISHSYGPKRDWTPEGLRAAASDIVYRVTPTVDHPYIIVSRHWLSPALVLCRSRRPNPMRVVLSCRRPVWKLTSRC